MRYILVAEEDDFKQWMEKQRKLQENIKRVCEKYGEMARNYETVLNLVVLVLELIHFFQFIFNLLTRGIGGRS